MQRRERKRVDERQKSRKELGARGCSSSKRRRDEGEEQGQQEAREGGNAGGQRKNICTTNSLGENDKLRGRRELQIRYKCMSSNGEVLVWW